MENLLSLKNEKNKSKEIPSKTNYIKLANNTLNKNPLKIKEKVNKNQDHDNNFNKNKNITYKFHENEKNLIYKNNNNNDSINNCNISFENTEIDSISKNLNLDNNYNNYNYNKNNNNNFNNTFNTLLKEADQLKNEYIQQRSSIEDIFELDEILVKNEDLLEIYDFGDRQHNLIDVYINIINYIFYL
jgi:hypothetical protein